MGNELGAWRAEQLFHLGNYTPVDGGGAVLLSTFTSTYHYSCSQHLKNNFST